jgi:hypothetical protein
MVESVLRITLELAWVALSNLADDKDSCDLKSSSKAVISSRPFKMGCLPIKYASFCILSPPDQWL